MVVNEDEWVVLGDCKRFSWGGFWKSDFSKTKMVIGIDFIRQLSSRH